MKGSIAWSKLPAHAKELFGLELGHEELAKLAAFLDLVVTWSARMNLVGPSSRDDLIDRHLLDSFAPLTLLGPVRGVVDYGSGAGFPAIPIAVLAPESRVHLVESRRKRCSFLKQAARVLGLANVTIFEGRGEDWPAPALGVDVALGRALAADVLARLAIQALPPGGRLVIMRKQGTPAVLEGFAEIESRRYRLPRGELHEVAAYRRLG